MAERPRGMGRGLAAILSPTDPAEGGEAQPELRELPVELIEPEPAPAAPALRRGGAASRSPSRCASAACCSRCSCARCPGGTLRADRRRAPLARRPARRARRRPGASCARTRTRESLELALIENMAREDLNPVEEARACSLLVDELGLTREEVGRRVGRSRVAVSNLLRLLDLPDEVLDAARRRPPQRGPRPRAADGARPRRPPPARPRRGRRGLDGARDRGPRPRGRRPRRGRAATRRAAPSTRTRSRPRQRLAGRARPRRSAPTSASRRAATGYTSRPRLSTSVDVAERLSALGRASRRATAPA